MYRVSAGAALVALMGAGCQMLVAQGDLATPPDAVGSALDLGSLDAVASVGTGDLVPGPDLDSADLAVIADLRQSPDDSLAIDLSNAPDFTVTSDLSTPPDLAPSPDLAIPPDAAIVPDLSIATDLAAPPDLVAWDLASTPDVASVCGNHLCGGTCDPGWGDCDGNSANGCEANLTSSSANCGACGVMCAAGIICVSGRCGCAAPTTPCSLVCVNLSTDANNCGGCGVSCSALHANANTSCAGGVCQFLGCLSPYRDCSGMGNCNFNTNTDVNNCGGCAITCGKSTASTTVSCVGGQCTYTCAAGYTSCSMPPSGCNIWIGGDPKNCGGCGKVCSTYAVTAQCTAGVCSGACQAGFGDCNSDKLTDGCETQLCGNPTACGGCGIACSSGLCISGACQPSRCDDHRKNGGESDVDCGGPCAPCARGKTCTVNTDCQSGVCSAGACLAPLCSDGIRDGGETGIDCGGPCAPCANGSACAVAADCQSRRCVQSQCLAPSTTLAFAAARTYAADTDPRRVVLVALRPGGALDAVAVHPYGSGFSVLLNDGAGGFGAPTKYTTGLASWNVAAGDFNLDGLADVLVADSGSGSVAFYAGLGTGALKPMVTLSAPNSSPTIALGDMDGDGKPDLVGAGSNVWVLYGNGAGGIATSARALTPTGASQGVAISDWDGNGFGDVMTWNGGAGYMLTTDACHVVANAGSTYAAAPTVMIAADVNGDGHLDALTEDPAKNQAVILLGKNNFYLTNSVVNRYAVGTSPNGIAAGDLDGDGALDLVTPNEGDGTVSVLLGNGDGTFKPQLVFAVDTSPTDVAIGDVDGDGRPDIVAGCYAHNDLVVLINQSP